MKWFRVYDDIIDDPKILRLSPENRWNYVAILSISSRQSARGSLPSVADISLHLRISEARATRVVEAMLDAGLIDQDPDGKGLAVHGWEQRQFKSDDATDRWRKHMDRKSANVGANVGAAAAPTDQSRSRSRDRTEQKPPTPRGEAAAPLPDETDPPEYPDPLTSMHIIMTGEHRMEELEARELWGHIWRSFRRSRLCFQFYEHQQWLTVDEWMYAIKTAKERGDRPHSIRFLEKIGMDMEAGLAKAARPVTRGELGSVPYRPTTAPRTASAVPNPGSNGADAPYVPRVYPNDDPIPEADARAVMNAAAEAAKKARLA